MSSCCYIENKLDLGNNTHRVFSFFLPPFSKFSQVSSTESLRNLPKIVGEREWRWRESIQTFHLRLKQEIRFYLFMYYSEIHYTVISMYKLWVIKFWKILFAFVLKQIFTWIYYFEYLKVMNKILSLCSFVDGNIERIKWLMRCFWCLSSFYIFVVWLDIKTRPLRTAFVIYLSPLLYHSTLRYVG